jgi:putative RNA 2'-phosphotransferase
MGLTGTAAGEDRRLSKTLSYWLRHRPDAGALVLDAQGWADVGAVLAALERSRNPASVDRLRTMIDRNDKQRFELSADARRIRARQGHSVGVALGWPSVVPPDLLYHGTVGRNLDAILTQGLRPMQRHHVHLSPDAETARRVGARRGPPVILGVKAGELNAGGTPFFLTANQVWLVEAVPPHFIALLETAAGGGRPPGA